MTQEEKLTAYLESQAFYDLMQSYRFAPILPQRGVVCAFEEIKRGIIASVSSTNVPKEGK